MSSDNTEPEPIQEAPRPRLNKRELIKDLVGIINVDQDVMRKREPFMLIPKDDREKRKMFSRPPFIPVYTRSEPFHGRPPRARPTWPLAPSLLTPVTTPTSRTQVETKLKPLSLPTFACDSTKPPEHEFTSYPSTEIQYDTLKFVPKSIEENDWDVYLLSLLSENTAKWLVLKKTVDGERKQRLEQLLRRWYGTLPDPGSRAYNSLELVYDPVHADESVAVWLATGGLIGTPPSCPQTRPETGRDPYSLGFVGFGDETNALQPEILRQRTEERTNLSIVDRIEDQKRRAPKRMLTRLASDNAFQRQHTGLGYVQVRVRDADSDDMLYLSPRRALPNENQEIRQAEMILGDPASSVHASFAGRLGSQLFPRSPTYDEEGNLRKTWPGLGAIAGDPQRTQPAASGDGDGARAVFRHRKHVEPVFPRDLHYWRDVDERALLDAKEGVFPTVTLDADATGLSSSGTLTQMQTHVMNQPPGVAVGRLPSTLARTRFSRQLRALRGEPDAAMSSEKPRPLRVLQGHRRWVHMPTFEDERNRYLLKPLPPEAITLPPLPDHIENPLGTSGQGASIDGDTSSALLSPEKTHAKAQASLADGQPFAEGTNASDSELVAQREVRRLKLTKIVDEWRKQWYMSRLYENTSWERLEARLRERNDLVKLKAILACSRALHVAARPGALYQPESERALGPLPPPVHAILRELSRDPAAHERAGARAIDLKVRRAAAICLFTLEYYDEPDAREVLRAMLRDPNVVDRWAAVQCLAHSGANDSDTVRELIAQLLDTYREREGTRRLLPDEQIELVLKRQHAVALLAALSKNSPLVVGLLAEQLNSVSYKARAAIAETLPSLSGLLSRDIVRKLIDIMWNDWHEEVRLAAARTLGRTGNGKQVHDSLCTRLRHEDATARIGALRFIRHLGIMTGKMYKNFLVLFEDDHVSVRVAICVVCGELRLADQLVMANLLHLIKYDASGPVRLEAALGVRLICQHRLSALVGRRLGARAPDSDGEQSDGDCDSGSGRADSGAPDLSLLSAGSQRSTPASPLHPRARARARPRERERPAPAGRSGSGSGPSTFRSGGSGSGSWSSGASGSGPAAKASGPTSASSGGGPLMLTGRNRESTVALAGIVAQVRSTAIWCFRYESIPALRAEACATLVALHMCHDDEVQQALLDRHLMEEDSLVRQVIQHAMIIAGFTEAAEVGAMTSIRDEVRRLCNKHEISARILALEQRERQASFDRRYLWDPSAAPDRLDAQAHSEHVVAALMERMARKGLVPDSGLQDGVSSDILPVDERATPATPDLYYGREPAMAVEGGEEGVGAGAGGAEEELRQQSRVSFQLADTGTAAESRAATAKSGHGAGSSERTTSMSVRSRSAAGAGRASRQQKAVTFELDQQPGGADEGHEADEVVQADAEQTEAEVEAELQASIDGSTGSAAEDLIGGDEQLTADESGEPRVFSEGERATREIARFEMALLIGGERTQEKLRETERELETADSLDMSVSSLAVARMGAPAAGGLSLSRVSTAASSVSVGSSTNRGTGTRTGTLASHGARHREASWSSFYERVDEDPEQLARLARIRQRTREFARGRLADRDSQKQRAAPTATAARSVVAAGDTVVSQAPLPM